MEGTQMGGGICQGYLTIAHDFVNFSTHGRAMVEETEGKGAVFRAIFEKKQRRRPIDHPSKEKRTADA